MISLTLESDDYNKGKMHWIAEGDDSEFFCSKCFKSIDKGYWCENKKRKLVDGKIIFKNALFCDKCQSEFKMIRCPHDAEGHHEHIRFIRN
jgi:hypothetical protein